MQRMSLNFILMLAVSSAIFMAAASSSRAYVSSENWLWILLSMSLYVTGNLIMIRIMREGGLGLAISLSSIVQLLLINVIAFAFYGERLTNVQLGGVVLGVVAMMLMMWPQSASS